MVTFDERIWQEWDGHKRGNKSDEEFAEYILGTAVSQLSKLSNNDSAEFDLSDEEIETIATMMCEYRLDQNC